MAAPGLARLSASAVRAAASCLPRRTLSTLAAFGYDRAGDEAVVSLWKSWRGQCNAEIPPLVCPQEFPRVARGLDYNLNWSLAGDRLTTRGEAYRNASLRDLIEFTPRTGARVTKGRALIVDIAAPAATTSFATDVVHGTSVMDVAEAESRTTAVSASGRCGQHRCPTPLSPAPAAAPRRVPLVRPAHLRRGRLRGLEPRL